MPCSSKSQLRALMKEKRTLLFQKNPDAGDTIVAPFFSILLPPDAIVGAYWPIGTELDVRPLLTALVAKGIPCALPCVEGADMLFRIWDPAVELVQNGRLWEPPPSSPVVKPTVLLVPLLAFDAQRHRLGYGKGHYDRYLYQHKVLSIGVGFEGQEVPAVPSEPHDRVLDVIVTERGLG